MSVLTKAVLRKAGVADKEASRPGRFLLQLTVEDVKTGDARQSALPFRLKEIRLICQDETAVDLFAGEFGKPRAA